MTKTPLRVTDNSCLTRTFFMEGHWSYETTFTSPSKNFAKREQSPQGSQWRNIIKISSPPPTNCLNSHRDFRHYKWFQQESLLSFLPTAPNKIVVQSHEQIPRSRFVAVCDCVRNVLSGCERKTYVCLLCRSS